LWGHHPRGSVVETCALPKHLSFVGEDRVGGARLILDTIIIILLSS